MYGKRLRALVLAVLVPLAAWAGSTQTGTLRGTVFDSKGEPVVGALISIHSPALIRERVVLTDAQGGFFAPGLPAGDYKVIAKLEGYITVELSTDIEVDKTTPLSVTLKEGELTETLTVTAERPIVDKTNTESSVTLEKGFTEQLPVPRSDLSLLTFAPGVVDPDGDGNANFLGGTSNSNNYLVDGVSSKDPVTGTFGRNLNYDAIETIDVKLTGISAEYGQTQGGISNVILKSGGNEFTGSFRDVISAPSWTRLYADKARQWFAPEGPIPGTVDPEDPEGGPLVYGRPDLPTRTDADFDKADQLSVTLGGPVVVDNAWFFLAYDRIETTATDFLGNPQGGPGGNGSFIDTFDGDIGSLKLTWQATNNQRFMYSFSEDPATTTRCYGQIFFTGPCFDTRNVDNQKQGGFEWIGDWNATWSPTVISNVKIARFKNTFQISPLTPIEDIPGIPRSSSGEIAPAIELSTLQTFDANIFDEFPEARNREQYEATVTKFLDTDKLGSHTIKIGADYQEMDNPGNTAIQGNSIFYFFAGAGPDPYDVDNRFYYLWVDFPVLPNNSTPRNEYTAVYLNDEWQLNANWAFNLGVRWEKSNNVSDIGETIIKDTGFAPRLGVSFDVRGDGKHVVKGTAARYLAGINITTLGPFTRLAGGTASYDVYFNTSPDPGNPADTDSWLLITSVRAESSAQAAPKVKPQSIDEYTLSYEILLNPTFGLSARAISRDWSNILMNQGRYDYASGIPEKITTLRNNPAAKRKYEALVLGAQKRFADNFSFDATYTWSRAIGNVLSDESFDSFNIYPDVPQTTENRYGRLDWDTPHAFKFQGYYQIPLRSARHGLTVGTVGQFLSGLPYARNNGTRNTVVGPGPDGEQDSPLGTPGDEALDDDQTESLVAYFEPRGSHRGPSTYNIDLSFVYRFRFAKNTNFETRFEVFNVTDQQRPTAVSSSWFENPAGDNAQLETNYTFGSPTAYQGFFQNPRTYQVQFAVTW
ncbi:MAG TPA: TonB-dependent receptor [Candidatus Polarisedimenticolaceae bacterium]